MSTKGQGIALSIPVEDTVGVEEPTFGDEAK